MPKRKPFMLGDDGPPAEPSREIERLFAAELDDATRPILRDLPIARILPNPFQARQSFDHLAELVASIRTQGFVSRLRVRPHPELADHFQLVYGERRLRAATAAGLDAIPCEIAPHSDAQLIEIGLAENIQRQDLDPLEEAQAFKTMLAHHDYTQQRLADRIGKDVSYVTERLHLLEATPPDVQTMVRQRSDTLRSAREIAKLPDAATRAPLIADVLEHRLSTRAVRDAVRAQLSPAADAATGDAPPPTETALAHAAPLPGVTIDRDLRNIRTIFERWHQQLATLEEPYLSRVITFLVDEHLPQVDSMIQTLEQRR